MSRGKRYNGEQKLNIKKVIAVILTFAIIIGLIVGIVQILNADKNAVDGKNIELNYFTMYSDGNWGVINSSGEVILKPVNEEMVLIPNKAKAVFICTYDVNYKDGTYKTKAVNAQNEQLFTDYNNVYAIQNHNTENNSVWFEENTLKVQKDGKYGLINLDGKELLPCEYDSITTIVGVKNSLIIKKDGKVGIANNNGTIIVPAEYADVKVIDNNYENGYIVKTTDSKYGVIKSTGGIALEAKYEDIKSIVDSTNYIAKIDGTWEVVAEDGTTYLEGKVDEATEMQAGDVITKQDGKFGVMNIATQLKIPFEYEKLTYMFDDKYIACKDGKYGIINTNNEALTEFKYENISYNKKTDYIKATVNGSSNGQNETSSQNAQYDYIARDLALKFTAGEEEILDGFIKVKVGENTKYYNYKLEEKTNKDVYADNTLFITQNNGKYGFVNKKGDVIVEAIYDDATEQNKYGYSAIKKDGKWGAIDQYGNVVVEPTYALDNNTVIDFIGQWHISEDTNYYCK